MSKMEQGQDSDSLKHFLIYASKPVLSLKRLGTVSEMSVRSYIHATQREERIKSKAGKVLVLKI